MNAIDTIKNQTTNYAIDALKQKCFFKLVCGASLTDTEMVENLSYIFTIAGAHVIDLAPKADVIFAARRGIERGRDSRDMSWHVSTTPLLMASIQLDKDPHFRKVEVDYNLCDLCSACVKICPTEAFKIAAPGEPRLWREDKKFIYSIEKCYGCGICPSYCHVSALNMIDTKPSPIETLKEMILLNIDAIEFHFGKNIDRIKEIWRDIQNIVETSGHMSPSCNKPLFSFSIGSGLLSDEEIKYAANLCYKLAGKDIILQCDGTPMSGGNVKNLKNGQIGYNMDNPSLQVAKIIEKENLPVYLQISGGTNQDSYTMAEKANININGVAIGSYARKLLMPFLNNLDNKEHLEEAVNIARSLVNSVGRKI